MRASFGSGKWFVTMLLLGGCASGAPYFNGRIQQPVVEGEAVQLVDRAPESARQLGQVRAECWRSDLGDVSEPTRFRYSDLICDRELLLAGMRHKAAEVGGTLLVDTNCNGAPDDLLCVADVFRVEPDAHDPGPDEPGVELAERSDHPWETCVEFHPSGDFKQRPLAQRAPRASSRVSLLHYQRANEVTLGELSVACDECSTEELEVALRSAAGSLGARTVVELSCRDSIDAGRLCSAKLTGFAAPSADPETL